MQKPGPWGRSSSINPGPRAAVECKTSGVTQGGCWCLELTDALTSNVDANRTLVSNIGRTIMKKVAVKFERNEIMSIDDFDVFACYRDLWKTKSEKRNKEMLSDQESSLLMGAQKTALNRE